MEAACSYSGLAFFPEFNLSQGKRQHGGREQCRVGRPGPHQLMCKKLSSGSDRTGTGNPVLGGLGEGIISAENLLEFDSPELEDRKLITSLVISLLGCMMCTPIPLILSPPESAFHTCRVSSKRKLEKVIKIK